MNHMAPLFYLRTRCSPLGIPPWEPVHPIELQVGDEVVFHDDQFIHCRVELVGETNVLVNTTDSDRIASVKAGVLPICRYTDAWEDYFGRLARIRSARDLVRRLDQAFVNADTPHPHNLPDCLLEAIEELDLVVDEAATEVSR